MNDNSTTKKIFLAGSTGLVGSALIPELLKHNYQIQAIYHQTEPFIQSPHIHYSQTDLTSNLPPQLFDNCESAILSAAYTGGVQQAIEKPWEQVNHNLIMNAKLLENLALSNLKRIIFIIIFFSEFLCQAISIAGGVLG